MPGELSRKYILTLALVSGSILVAGTLLKPKNHRSDSESILSPTEMIRLERLAQRRSLDNMASYFSRLAADLEPSIVRLDPSGRSAVFWEPSLIVTSAGLDPMHQMESVPTLSGGVVPAEITVACPGLPVSALQTVGQAGLAVPRRIPIEFVAPGSWLLSVWRRADQRYAFAPAHLLGTQVAACDDLEVREIVLSLTLDETMRGGAVFDLDGSLAGIIALCGERFIVLANDGVEAALQRGASLEGRMLTRYGMWASPFSDKERAYFGNGDGALVREVWRGRAADRNGLEPGDVIQTVGSRESGESELEALVSGAANEAFALTVRRGRQKLQITLPARAEAARDSNVEQSAGFGLAPPAAGFRIDAVVPGSRAEKAGIRPGDRLVRLNQTEPRSAEEVSRALAGGSQAAFLVLERGDRRWGLLLQ